jgi:hypothetical protein
MLLAPAQPAQRRAAIPISSTHRPCLPRAAYPQVTLQQALPEARRQLALATPNIPAAAVQTEAAVVITAAGADPRPERLQPGTTVVDLRGDLRQPAAVLAVTAGQGHQATARLVQPLAGLAAVHIQVVIMITTEAMALPARSESLIL